VNIAPTTAVVVLLFVIALVGVYAFTEPSSKKQKSSQSVTKLSHWRIFTNGPAALHNRPNSSEVAVEESSGMYYRTRPS